MKIFLIEDDTTLAESLKEYLDLEGFYCDIIKDLDLIDYYELDGYDLILLDLMLKDKKGEHILCEIRKRGIKQPILIITAKNDITTKEVCFRYGADDYLVKPFDPKELALRINALLRRTYCWDRLIIDNVEIDFSAKSLKVDGVEIILSKIEWELLCLLAQHRGKIVTMEKILNYIWKDKSVGTDSIRTYIKNLRRVLPEGFIVTYKGRGYKLK
ncbi:MAG: response regulator transcription factor [Calditerrivibrio sp.]|nr:response regulator transcription factor [Calditerrivibrio sp.]